MLHENFSFFSIGLKGKGRRVIRGERAGKGVDAGLRIEETNSLTTKKKKKIKDAV